MAKVLEDNLFSLLGDSPKIAAVAAGVKEGNHFIFEAGSAGEGAEFAAFLQRSLKGEGTLVFAVNLSMAISPERLVKDLARAFVDPFAGDLNKIGQVVKKLIPTATTRLVMGNDPHLEIEYGADIDRLFASLMDVPETIAKEEGRRAVVLWQCFENISVISGGETLRTFLDKAGAQSSVSHILIGGGISALIGGRLPDKTHTQTIAELLTPDMMAEQLVRSFNKSGARLSGPLAAKIVEAGGGQVDAVRAIAGAAFRLWGATAEPMILAEAVRDVLSAAGPAYGRIWELLNARQRAVLYGICGQNGGGIYTAPFIRDYGFKTATNLQAAVRGLEQKGIVVRRGKKRLFADPLFARWVRRATGRDLE